MFRFLNSVPIFRRLLIIFILATVIPVIVVFILGNFFLDSLQQRAQAVSTSFDAQSIASQELNNLQLMNANLKTLHENIFAVLNQNVLDPSLGASGALVDSDIVAREAEFQQAQQDYDAHNEIATSPNMDTIRTIIQRDAPGDPVIQDQSNALDKVHDTLWPQYKTEQDAVLKKLDAIKAAYVHNPIALTPEQINADYESVYPSLYQANADFTNLKNNWQFVVDTAVTTGKLVTTIGPSLTQPVNTATIVAISSVSLLGLIAALIITLTITRPLSRLAALTRRITMGDRSARIKIVGRDEINQVATSMNMMLDHIVQLIHATEQQRDELQAQVNKLLSEVSGVGEGNLSIQAQVATGALGAVADSFNYMVEELSNLVVRVKMVAREVESSTTMTLGRMTQLVTSADTQIKQITLATVEAEQVAHSSHQVAERAQIFYNSALEARQTTQMGRQSVQLTVEGIARILEYVQHTSAKVQALGERSRTINNIVDIITNLAHQTNRLSLDAAIQAAMAGESGKGFRAVADDIRRMAEDAKNQANSITQLVRSLREDIGAVATSMKETEQETLSGTNLTQQTGHSLDAIFAVVEHQAQEIAAINQAARQQSLSSNIVVKIMQEVSNTTRQNTSSTHAVEQSMERLALLANQLQTSVDAFKLRDNRESYPGRPQIEDVSRTRNTIPRSPMHPVQTFADAGQPTNTSWYLNSSVSAEGSGAAPAHPSTAYAQQTHGRVPYNASQQNMTNTMP